MNTLLTILGHSTVVPTIRRHFPFWCRGEADLLLVGRENTKTEWPAGNWVNGGTRNLRIWRRNIGQESYVAGSNHLDRFTDVLRMFIFEPDFRSYDAVCITEYDAVLMAPIPDAVEFGLYSHVAGFCDVTKENFHASRYLHTPWLMNRETAEEIFPCLMRLLNARLFEQGFVDRWLGLFCELFDCPVIRTGTFSVNALDTPIFMEAARQAIANGAWHVHGVKTAQQLEQLIR